MNPRLSETNQNKIFSVFLKGFIWKIVLKFWFRLHFFRAVLHPLSSRQTESVNTAQSPAGSKSQNTAHMATDYTLALKI